MRAAGASEVTVKYSFVPCGSRKGFYRIFSPDVFCLDCCRVGPPAPPLQQRLTTTTVVLHRPAGAVEDCANIRVLARRRLCVRAADAACGSAGSRPSHVPNFSEPKCLQLATRDRPGLPTTLTRHKRANLRGAVLSHADSRSRGWRSEAGNRTRRLRYRWEGDAWASEGWRQSGAWDGGPDGAATLSGDEVRLALSTSVGASEEAAYIDATLSNWLGFTMRSTHVVLHNDANRRTPLLRPSYLCAPRPERTFRPARPWLQRVTCGCASSAGSTLACTCCRCASRRRESSGRCSWCTCTTRALP